MLHERRRPVERKAQVLAETQQVSTLRVGDANPPPALAGPHQGCDLIRIGAITGSNPVQFRRPQLMARDCRPGEREDSDRTPGKLWGSTASKERRRSK